MKIDFKVQVGDILVESSTDTPALDFQKAIQTVAGQIAELLITAQELRGSQAGSEEHPAPRPSSPDWAP